MVQTLSRFSASSARRSLTRSQFARRQSGSVVSTGVGQRELTSRCTCRASWSLTPLRRRRPDCFSGGFELLLAAWLQVRKNHQQDAACWTPPTNAVLPVNDVLRWDHLMVEHVCGKPAPLDAQQGRTLPIIRKLLQYTFPAFAALINGAVQCTLPHSYTAMAQPDQRVAMEKKLTTGISDLMTAAMYSTLETCRYKIRKEDADLYAKTEEYGVSVMHFAAVNKIYGVELVQIEIHLEDD
ncbi:Hypothetical predicted protein [Cloeon dipterum]|uniref:Uncharacterized protein n=1 Tax=Cloeon dipterum TaxID=197152 RepID=A0A8S1DY48_9INSE|nr:Hypothetical predicted protein [Cloeon dipterum]